MTSLVISEIKNENLRKAAEMADSQGKQAFNHKLDANEVGIFVQEAKRMGCSYNDIIQITNSVGLSHKNSAMKIEQLKNIENLEAQLKQAKRELIEAKNELYDMTPCTTAERVTTGCGVVGGMAAGGYAGVKLATAVGGALAATGIGAIPVGIVACVVGLGCCLGGAFLGGTAGEKAGTLFDDESTGKERTNANNYNEKVVKPLQERVAQIEKELENAKNAFYDEK